VQRSALKGIAAVMAGLRLTLLLVKTYFIHKGIAQVGFLLHAFMK